MRPQTFSSFDWLLRFADSLRARRGWRQLVLALAYGALSSLAFAPLDVVPALWISFPALIFLLQGTNSSGRAFLVGWCFAFGFFVPDLYWTAVSMFVDIAHFWWAVPLALCGLPAFFAIYYGIAAALARKYGLRGLSGISAFVLLWFLADYARGHLFTGFPWNIEGYIWADFLPVLQITSLVGIYGLTLITLFAVCLPACLAEKRAPAFYRATVITFLAGFILAAAWGSWRLTAHPVADIADVRLRLVQPNIPQKSKWEPRSREDNFDLLLSLSSAVDKKPLAGIILPETAVPFYLTDDEIHRRAAANLLGENASFITGVLRNEPTGDGHLRFYNSLVAIAHDGHVAAAYDKFHLVPFGEYVPFRTILPVQALAGMGLDFSHGPGPRTLHVPGLPPFSPLICYEVIFPGKVVDRSDPPQFLLNITNDGWYGRSAGPYQHFAIARVRAAEEGLPLVRVANTGISGIVDPYGRVEKRLGLDHRGVIDGDLPRPLSSPTFFSRAGEYPIWLTFVFLSLVVLFRTFVSRPKRSS